jgi:hypothetical protein
MAILAIRNWTCSCCGKTYSGLPLDYDVVFPDYYIGWRRELSQEEINRRSVVNSDICVVDNEFYFVRGVIELPVLGFREDSFRWGAWVSLSEKSFKEVMDLSDVDPAGHGPYFGWLNTDLPLYSPTSAGLKTIVHLRGGNKRPSIELEPSDHPLAAEQRQGITIERIQQIAAALLHKDRA